MEQNVFPKIGKRTVKTIISTILCAILYSILFNRSAAFACIGAVFGMESSTSTNPWRTGWNRIAGTVIGGLLGMGLFYINLQFKNQVAQILLLGLGVVLLIYISQFFGCTGAIHGGSVVFFILMLSTPSDQYVVYALNRIFDTALGVSISVVINVIHLKIEKRLFQREK